jgi:uracil-DNA glycosylase
VTYLRSYNDMDWDDLEFWNSGEWQVIEERLNDYDKQGTIWNPGRNRLFSSFICPFDAVKVVIVGQDPYPNPNHATGMAFSVPKTCTTYPPSLANILSEYVSDTGYPTPKSGDLTSWARNGVLLWNCTPTCLAFRPGSHKSWTEWEYLTKEIITELDKKCVVFVLMGGHARALAKLLAQDKDGYTYSDIVETTHPSPMANIGKQKPHPFFGTRIFTTANIKLRALGKDTVDWRLP